MKLDIVPEDIISKLKKRIPKHSDKESFIAYNYLDEDGEIIGAVGRVDYDDNGKSKKSFVQLDWNRQYKKYKSIADIVKLSLYNRDKMKTAHTVVWVEGEKAATALQSILPEGVVATTNAGGGQNVKNANLTPMIGKKVIIWHDNDMVGRHSAIKLSTRLNEMSIQVAGWVKVDDHWGDKFDAYDVIEQDGADYALSKLKDLTAPQEKSIDVPEIIPGNKEPFMVLGRSVDDDIVVYCYQDATIRSFSSSSFDEGMMVKIYNDMSFWYEYCGLTQRSQKPDKDAGFQRMWQEVLKYGIFHPEVTRYGGVYKEGEDYVAHLGDRLFVNGKEDDLSSRMEDSGIYVEDRKSDIDTTCEALSTKERKDLVDYFEGINIKTREQRQLVLGWAVASILAPILPKRPHLWLFAPANTGKSYISNKLRSIIEPFAVNLDSSRTTFAGLKQFVQGRGCAVFWDESEAQERGQKEKWNQVMEVVRVSFDSRDGKIVQGSKEQVAKFFVPRMMFCFSSVKMADFEETLSTRIVPIEVIKLKDKKEMSAYYKESKNREKKIDWDKLPEKLFKLVYGNANDFFQNYETAYDLFIDCGCDERRSSALSVCFAGFVLIKYNKVLSEDDARNIIWAKPYELMPEQESDAEALQAQIMSGSIVMKDSNGQHKTIIFRDFVRAMDQNDYDVNSVSVKIAAHEFKAMGLQYLDDRKRVFVWDKSPRLNKCIGFFAGINSVAPSLDGYSRDRRSGLSGFSFDIFE